MTLRRLARRTHNRQVVLTAGLLGVALAKYNGRLTHPTFLGDAKGVNRLLVPEGSGSAGQKRLSNPTHAAAPKVRKE